MFNLMLGKSRRPNARKYTGDRWWKFSAYNSQAQYGWGDEAEASAYADFMNQDREINHYTYSEAEGDHEDDGFNLADSLAEIG
ncbi:MAG: hypothetical protein ABL904_17085 [Hyphomicrobiaceae bacterium]